MSNFSKIILWWLAISIVWGVFRLTNPSEVISELVAKPIIWLGITLVAFKFSFLPQEIITDLKKNYLQTKPILTVFIAPIVFILFYFFLINFRNVSIPTLGLTGIALSLVINFSTGVVEEIVYRGVLYVWLLKNKSEFVAFTLVQILFLLGHLPTIMLNSESLEVALTRSFFIVFIGSIHTLIFRITKSLYSSSITHGIWNSLVRLLLLG